MELIKESFYNIEYKLSNNSSEFNTRIIADDIEEAIKIFKKEFPNYIIIKVNFVGYIYRLPYKTITVNV